jgi:hypothetical protein
MDRLPEDIPAPPSGTVGRNFAAEMAAAVVGLAEASKFLENSGYGSAEMMEECLAAVRAAECRVTCVLFAWRDYLNGGRGKAQREAEAVRGR